MKNWHRIRTRKFIIVEFSVRDYKDLAEFIGFVTENGSDSHPFEAEITALVRSPQPEIELSDDFEVVDLETNDSYVWVDTEVLLKELVNELSKEKFFAVDTEQHSLHSFLGFTALVQVILCCFEVLSTYL